MKPFIAAHLTKLSTCLMLGALGVSLVGLPTVTVAQDAVGTSESVHALHSSRRKIYVDHTKWLVEPAKNGHKHDYHSEPWVFSPDGTAHSGHLWHGTWHMKSHDTITVVLRMNDRSGALDQFDVKFKSPSKFTAYKHGRAYRYGVRQ